MLLETDLIERRRKIQKQMGEIGMEGCLLTMPLNLYYLCGSVFNGYYYLPTEGEPQMFVKRPSNFVGKSVHFIRKPEQIPDLLRERGGKSPEKLLLEGDELTYNEHLRLQHIFNLGKIGNITPLICRMRMIKSPWEIQQMQHTAEKQVLVYSQIPECYRPGMTDLELQYEIEYRMRRNGSIGFFRTFGNHMEIFMGSLLAGDNAAVPSPYDFALGGKGLDPSLPGGVSGTLLKAGQCFMVDMGGNFYGYMGDMSRVFSIGKLPEQAYAAHQTCMEVQEEVTAMAKPGTACEDMYNKAIDIVTKAGFADYFMGVGQKAKFIGHGIGLEINEMPVLAPRMKQELEPGMVFALEPKIVLPDIGPVGIENSWVVTTEGLEKLTLCGEEIVEL